MLHMALSSKSSLQQLIVSVCPCAITTADGDDVCGYNYSYVYICNHGGHFGAPLSHFVHPRAFPSTPIALCASAVDCHCECLRDRFGYPYRTFALVFFTLARAKGISVHPYRTLRFQEHFRAPLSHFAPLQMIVIALFSVFCSGCDHFSYYLRCSLNNCRVCKLLFFPSGLGMFSS